MLRIILGAVVGFIIWSILWVGTDAILASVFSSWYGKEIAELEKATQNNQPFIVSSVILIISLIRSVVFSVISGYLSALVSKENSLAPLISGILLLAFGIFIQSVYWSYIPLWYHLSFLFLLIPVNFFGGKLRQV